MLIALIVVILVAIVLIVSFYYIGKHSVLVPRLAENKLIKEHNENLAKELQNKRVELNEIDKKIKFNLENLAEATIRAQEDYNKLINDLTIDYKNKEADYALRAAELSHNLNTITDMRFSKINRAATEYREKLYNDIKIDTEVALKDAQQKKDLALCEQKELQEELNNLRATRDAFIEANRREEELRLQQNFYKIVITEQNLNDIKLLKSVEQFLHDKEPLYKLIWSHFYIHPTKEMLNRIIGKEKTSGIYKITNQINGKTYIGQSVDLHARLTNHIKSGLGIGTIAHQLIHDAIATEGLENFTFEIIEKCDKEQLNKKEKLWIETYASDKYGYNRTAGGAKEE